MEEQNKPRPIAKVSVPLTFIKVLLSPFLRTTGLRCIASIFKNFFFSQYRAAFLPGLVPVSPVDHPLDKKIPFLPGKVNTYLDFTAFWIRTIGFLLGNCGRTALEPVRNFMETMGSLYAFAAEVYRKNLSTTERPFYISHPKFLLIHTVDPHLMCIPSLHVMIVICTYTLFADIILKLGAAKKFAFQAEELRRGAMAITEAVLYIKQHSVNCISAAMYAMTCFEPRLFPVNEAGRFADKIFRDSKIPGEKDSLLIREHILSLYRSFLAQGEEAGYIPGGNNTGADWKKPLLDFLKNQQ